MQISTKNIIFFIQKNYLGIIAIVVLLYVVYKVYQMFAEQNEPGELGSNTANTNYAPVPYNTVKTKNFNISELTCKDGTKVPAAYTGNAMRLLTNLQKVRDYLGVPMHINSGYRTDSHNKKVGGAPNSTHKRAMASDNSSALASPKKIYDAFVHLIAKGEIQDGGLSLYPNFVHYDVSTPRRW